MRMGYEAGCIAVAFAAGLGLTSAAAIAGEDRPSEAGPAAGMKVHIDPATGNILPTPPQGAPAGAITLSTSERNAFSKSSDGLVETPSSGPAGGSKVDLRGRFQSPLIATVGPDGKVEMRHGGQADPHQHR